MIKSPKQLVPKSKWFWAVAALSRVESTIGSAPASYTMDDRILPGAVSEIEPIRPITSF
jgi:hypothetical protein